MTDETTTGAHIYSVRATGANRWQVFQQFSTEPLASFDDKATALIFAMCLARGRDALYLLLREHHKFAQSAARASKDV